MKKKKKSPAESAKRSTKTWAYPVEFRLRMVRLFLEEGYSTTLLREQFGVSNHSIQRWVRAYQHGGAEGLEPKRQTGSKPRVPEQVRQQMVELKQVHPEYGPRRIADVLKRFFLIPTSPATVHKTLVEKALVKKARCKPVKNSAKPRFFERARPNQM